MTSTETKPSASGSAAAASEPKTNSRMISTTGKPADSALARSSLESSCIPAHSAPWPTRCVVTPSRRAVADPQPVAQVDGHLGGAVLVDLGAQRDDDRAAAARPARRPARARRPAIDTPSTGPAAAATRSTAAVSCSGAGARRGDEHGGELGPGDAREAVERAGDLRRLRAGDVEAAAGEVLGLAGGERDGRDEDGGPGDQDEAPAAAEQAVEAQHGGLHRGTPGRLGWLASQRYGNARTAVCARAHTRPSRQRITGR